MELFLLCLRQNLVYFKIGNRIKNPVILKDYFWQNQFQSHFITVKFSFVFTVFLSLETEASGLLIFPLILNHTFDY